MIAGSRSAGRPGGDRIRKVEEEPGPFARRQGTAAVFDRPVFDGQDTAETLEQRRLAGAVGPDQPEDLVPPDREGDPRKRGQACVALGQVAHEDEWLARREMIRRRHSLVQGLNLPGPLHYYQES